MIKNVGKVDRIIRLMIAAIASMLFITKTVTGTLGIVVLAVGAVALLTGILNFCGLYKLLGINTCPRK